MKLLNIKGYEVKLDDAMYERFREQKFSVSRQPSGQVYFQIWDKGSCFYLHRLIKGNPAGMVVDHKNHDTLDMQSSNLRVCTFKENGKNRRRYSNNTTGLRGVIERKDGRNKKWRAEIRVDGVTRNLGSYYTKEEAGRVYDAMALKVFGEFANLNYTDDIV